MSNTFRALSLMESTCKPLKYGHEPYFLAPVTPPSAEVLIPEWNWTSPHELPEGTELVTLDANAAYLGALGSATIAHSELVRLGPWDTLPTPRTTPPGYYKVTVPYWAFSGTCVHPLGGSTVLAEAKTVWIAAPSLILLLELLDEGHLGPFSIVDSYTAKRTENGWRTVTFRTWADRLKSIRQEIMDARDHAHRGATRPHKCECDACARYDGFKEGYSMALSMMLTGDKCRTHRPDWTHTILAEHRATQWRKAWRFTSTGRPLVSMGDRDETTILASDLHTVLARPRPPFRFDASGRSVGAFKVKRTWTWTGEEVPAPTTAESLAHLAGDDAGF